jgi:large subunit ribosomal protein L9
MEVILREDVPNLGATGEIVRVRPGFARNYLLPRGMAVIADRRNVRVLNHEQRLAAEKRERDRRNAESLAQRLTATRVKIHARAGEEGKLFGSVTNLDIERALSDLGLEVERRRIRLEDPIKSLGEHVVDVQLSGGVVAHLTVEVLPQAG